MSDTSSCVRVVQVRATQGTPGRLIEKLQQECAEQTAQIMDIKIRLLLGAGALLAATPVSALPQKGDEPIAVPRTVKQGIDFVYVDPQLSTVAKRRQQRWLGLFEQARAVVKWSVCRFHAAARSGWLK